MKAIKLSLAASAAMFALCATATMSASAATSSRSNLQMAAGACQPFFSTTQARYSASGLTNGGTATFYVACSRTASGSGTGTGNTMMRVVVSNPTGASMTVNCTGRPGRVYGGNNVQGAAPRSAEIAAGSFKAFDWFAADFDDIH